MKVVQNNKSYWWEDMSSILDAPKQEISLEFRWRENGIVMFECMFMCFYICSCSLSWVHDGFLLAISDHFLI